MSFHPTPAQSPTSVDDVMDAQEGLSKITIADSTLSWSDNEDKVARFNSLKETVLGNCRLLYGNDKFKYYDIVLGCDEDESTFCAALVCAKDGVVKVLRAVKSECPIKATRALTTRLQKDSMALLVKGGPGAMFSGQQGRTDENGQWVWTREGMVGRQDGAVDETESKQRPQYSKDGIARNLPRGPRHQPYAAPYKRGRFEEDPMLDYGPQH